MMEVIKQKFNEVKQWVSSRFDLNTKFGQVVANTELSVRAAGHVIHEKWDNFIEKIKDGKNQTEKKINSVIKDVKEDKKIDGNFIDKLSGWYQKQSENIYNLGEKINNWKLNWEIKKFEVIKDGANKKELKLFVIENMERINKKRVDYKNKAKKQKEAGLFFKRSLVNA